MTEKEMLRLAAEEGFERSAVLDTAELVFMPEFRAYCEANVCGNYGANHSCPPDCGTVEEMAQRVRKYRRALVLQTKWQVGDPIDMEKLVAAKGTHNRMTCRLVEKMGLPGLMMGAGQCDLCPTCTALVGEPCRFPEKKYSCMSAYCIHVKALCDSCGMDYDCGRDVVAFFSLYCFDAL